MEIREMSLADIDELSAFASKVFIDYYTKLISYEQSAYMAGLFLSPQAIEKLMREGARFKAVYDNDQIVAFYEFKDEGEKIFLSKLYVAEKLRGKGIGRLMFNDLLQESHKTKASAIYLTVNKGNTPSFNIYTHLGFKVSDAVVNDIGQGYVMDDYIMEYDLKAGN